MPRMAGDAGWRWTGGRAAGDGGVNPALLGVPRRNRRNFRHPHPSDVTQPCQIELYPILMSDVMHRKCQNKIDFRIY